MEKQSSKVERICELYLVIALLIVIMFLTFRHEGITNKENIQLKQQVTTLQIQQETTQNNK